MNLAHFFYGSYWFSQPNPAEGGVKVFYLVVLLSLIAAAIVLLFLRRRQTVSIVKSVMKRFSTLGFTMGITGLLLFLFRQERVFFLGWRISYLIWFVVLVWWLVRLLNYTFKRVPSIKAEQAERVRREKYLPKK